MFVLNNNVCRLAELKATECVSAHELVQQINIPDKKKYGPCVETFSESSIELDLRLWPVFMNR